ncbi:hypothetical protein REPUB_Repub03eG0260000 [Reevesia pubescens]
MARKKKGSWKAPRILWKIFKDKARSLATTISCIIPPLPPQSFPFTCHCKGRSCLQCCEDTMSFLLRLDDPVDYKNLLHDCFVVVNDNAPFLEFYPDRHWSQKQLTRSSLTVELLTSSAWDLLLERHTSIFVPLSDKKHLQVAGFPVNNLCKKLSKNERKLQSGIE